MTLPELLVALREKSGRLDLLDATLTEIINQGSRLLDELETSGKRTQRVFQILDDSNGRKYVTLPQEKRWINRVTSITAESRTELIKVTPEELRVMLHTEGTGAPIYYALISADLAGAPSSDNLDFTADYDLNVDSGNNQTYLYVAPIADAVDTYQIEVDGVFYSPFLSATVTVNRWSTLYSYLLLQAAMYWLLQDVFDFATADKLRNDLEKQVRSITHDAWSDEDFDELGG